MRMKLVLTAPTAALAGSTMSTRTCDSAPGPRREYATSVVIDGKTQSAHATACSEPGGTGRIES